MNQVKTTSSSVLGFSDAQATLERDVTLNERKQDSIQTFGKRKAHDCPITR